MSIFGKKRASVCKTAIDVRLEKLFRECEVRLVKKCITSSVEDLNIFFDNKEKELFQLFDTSYIQFRRDKDSFKKTIADSSKELLRCKAEYNKARQKYAEAEEGELNQAQASLYAQQLTLLLQSVKVCEQSISKYEEAVAKIEKTISNIETAHATANMKLKNTRIEARNLLQVKLQNFEYDIPDWSAHLNITDVMEVLRQEAKEAEYAADSKALFGKQKEEDAEVIAETVNSETGNIKTSKDFPELV